MTAVGEQGGAIEVFGEIKKHSKGHEKTREFCENLRILQCWHRVASFDWASCFYPANALYREQKSAPNRAISGRFELTGVSGWLFEKSIPLVGWLEVSGLIDHSNKNDLS